MSNRKAGVYDPGACAAGNTEADIVLQWALTLKWVGINEFGVDPEDIVLTRNDATDSLPVWKRDDIAASEGCTHLISLHTNAAGNPLARGTETFWAGNPREMDDYQFAERVQRAAMLAMGSKDRGIKHQGQSQHKNLAVFAKAHLMSACLLEIGFITNASDRKKMLDRNVRVEFARWFWKKHGFKSKV